MLQPATFSSDFSSFFFTLLGDTHPTLASRRIQCIWIRSSNSSSEDKRTRITLFFRTSHARKSSGFQRGERAGPAMDPQESQCFYSPCRSVLRSPLVSFPSGTKSFSPFCFPFLDFSIRFVYSIVTGLRVFTQIEPFILKVVHFPKEIKPAVLIFTFLRYLPIFKQIVNNILKIAKIYYMRNIKYVIKVFIL